MVTTVDLKAVGDDVYIVGLTRDELGGSHRLLLDGHVGSNVPRVDLSQARITFSALHGAIAAGLVRACHDLSEGGLGVAASEMTFGSDVGLSIDLRKLPAAEGVIAAEILLWSESSSRFMVEVAPGDRVAFEERLQAVPHARIGQVIAAPVLQVYGIEGTLVLDEPVAQLKAAWRQPLA
jgi:phosphoribosylformylglycinamidine synthase subunit PurSL